jgi:hypothetical protein
VVLQVAAVFTAAIRQHTQQRDILFLEPWQDAIIQEVGGDQSVLTVIQLGVCDAAVCVNERLLVNASHTFESADVEGVLCAKVAGMLSFDLAV